MATTQTPDPAILAAIAAKLEQRLAGKIKWTTMTERVITLYYLRRDIIFLNWADLAKTVFSWENEYGNMFDMAYALEQADGLADDILQND